MPNRECRSGDVRVTLRKNDRVTMGPTTVPLCTVGAAGRGGSAEGGGC